MSVSQGREWVGWSAAAVTVSVTAAVATELSGVAGGRQDRYYEGRRVVGGGCDSVSHSGVGDGAIDEADYECRRVRRAWTIQMMDVVCP